MKKSVIVISDRNAEIAPEITTILQASGLVVRSAGGWPFDHGDRAAKLVALVFQLPSNPELKVLRQIVEQARAGWPELPLIACALPAVELPARWRETIIEAGFNAAAESAAQLPALIRQLEEHEPADEPAEPFQVAPDDKALTMIDSMRRPELRGAFTLISALHGAASQSEAVSIAISGLGRLVKAQRWTIYLTQSAEPGVRLASLATRQFQEGELLSFNLKWHHELIENSE